MMHCAVMPLGCGHILLICVVSASVRVWLPSAVCMGLAAVQMGEAGALCTVQ
jgi:hypothetical protein